MSVIKAEQRQQQDTAGIPVPVLQAISKEMAKVAGKKVDDFIPMTRLSKRRAEQVNGSRYASCAY